MLFGKQIEFNEYDIFPSLTLTYKWVFQHFRNLENGWWIENANSESGNWSLSRWEPLRRIPQPFNLAKTRMV